MIAYVFVINVLIIGIIKATEFNIIIKVQVMLHVIVEITHKLLKLCVKIIKVPNNLIKIIIYNKFLRNFINNSN